MIEYRTTLDDLQDQHLEGFFVDWPKSPSVASHRKMLEGSYRRVLAFADDQLVGFVYAISDGVLSAYIPLLEVKPPYQGQGIGGELLRRLVDQLTDLYMIDLVCDPSLIPYYEKQGMSPLAGMAFRNYQTLEGPC